MKLMMSFVNGTDDKVQEKSEEFLKDKIQETKSSIQSSSNIIEETKSSTENDNSDQDRIDADKRADDIKKEYLEKERHYALKDSFKRLKNKLKNDIRLLKEKRNRKKNAILYDLSPAQSWLLLASMSIKKRAILNNSTLFILNKKVDLSLLNEAIDLELERNDSFKIRITKFKKRTVKQYFLCEQEKPKSDRKILDFSDKNPKKMFNKLQKLSGKSEKIYNTPLHRIYLIKSYDEKYGIFSIINNLIMDDFGISVFYKDIMYLYEMLKNGKEVVKEFNLYENILQRELIYENNITMQHKTNEFWKRQEITEMTSILCEKKNKKDNLKPDKTRKNNLKMMLARYIFPYKSLQYVINMDERDCDRIFNFCAENKLPFNTLIELCVAMFLYSKDTTKKEVCFLEGLSRRKGSDEKYSGGRREVYLPYSMVVDENQSFIQALGGLKKYYRKVVEFDKINPIKILDINNRYISAGKISYGDVIFTYHPVQMKFNYSAEYVLGNNQVSLVPLQITIIHNSGKKGGLDFYYKYRIKELSLEDIISLHKMFQDILARGIENPDITIKKLL